MHQVVWAKLLTALIGTTAHAQGAVLSVFMGGLALGAVLFGRRADRMERPLRTYIRLEVTIAAYCLLMPLLLGVASSAYVAIASQVFESTGLTFAIRFSLAIVCILLPAVLMGGTLPVLARHAIPQVSETRLKIGRLYSLNSLGAVAGAALAGFITLPLLGVSASLGLASLLNLAAGALVWPAARREREQASAADAGAREEPPAQAPAEPKETYGPLQYRVTLVALALSGFAAMGYEVLFARVIALGFGSTAYSFTVMLMAFISGIALGSAIIARGRIERPLLVLGMSQLVVVVALLAATPLVSRIPYWTGLMRLALRDASLGFELFQFGKAGMCLAILLVPTACLGFGFPLVAQIQARARGDIARRVGTTYAWNTAGNVVGTLATSLALIPALGLLGAFNVNFALNALAGLSILAVSVRAPAAPRWAAAAGTLLVGFVYLQAGGDWLDPLQKSLNPIRMQRPPSTLSAAELAVHPTTSFAAWRDTFVLDPEDVDVARFEEDAYGNVLAIERAGEAILYVNTKADASTKQDLATQMLVGHLPLFLNPDAESVLIIGHGSGVTAGSALLHPVKHADIVEISRAVLAVDPVFAEWNYHVLSDPRVEVHVDDAQSFLRTVPRKYDVIISEPTNPWISGVSGLFTVEFYRELRAKLAPGGVAAIWFQQYELSDESAMLILRTVNSVFPSMSLWRSPDYNDVIVVVGAEPVLPDFAAMEARFERREIRNDIARMGVPNLASLLIHHVMGAERLQRALLPGPINSAGHQRLEYLAPRDLFHGFGSGFLKVADPLRSGLAPPTDILLDRYAEWRRASGDAIHRDELEYVASRSGATFSAAIRARADQNSGPRAAGATSARGGVAKPEDMDLYEAAYWSNRYRSAGEQATAAPYLQRAASLLRARSSQQSR
jgi:spermidine synthase/MFS family permease